MKTILKVLFFSLLLTGCSTYKGEIPISSSTIKDFYISPKNMDGIKDSFKTTFSIPSTKGLRVTGYELSIISPSGQIVFLDKKGTPYVKKIAEIKKPGTITIPKNFEWYGKDKNGSFLVDGLYIIKLIAWDNKGNKGEITPYRIFIDNTPPTANIHIPFTDFSPNTASGLQVLTIYQDSTPENLWEGVVINSVGEDVIKMSWEGLLSNIDLDGFDLNKNIIPDGEYSYMVSSTDMAGNSFSALIDSIVIDRRDSELFFNKDNRYQLSPNNDGVVDTIDISLNNKSDLKFESGIVEIIDTNGEILKTDQIIQSSFPLIYTFDGYDNNDILLEPGIYYSRFYVNFKNGKKSNLVSNPIIIDIEKPSAVVSISDTVFSPEGDGLKDSILINQSTSMEIEWLGEIRNSKDEVVYSNLWNDSALSFEWNGLSSDKNSVPDGLYYYTLSSTDLAGNSDYFTSKPFEVDRTLTTISIDMNTNNFSPNGDGINDSIELLLKADIQKGIDSWNISIKNSDGDEVYYKDGFKFVPNKIYWNGELDQTFIKDGEYSVDFEVLYVKGNNPRVSTDKNITVDITPPEIVVEVPDVLFSPDNDGINDTIDIKISAKDNLNKFNITATILDPTGKVFRTLTQKDFPNNIFTWDGFSDSRELVQSASDYEIVVEAVDAVGNSIKVSKKIPVDILVIKIGDKLHIVISSIYFKPNTADFVGVEPELYEKNLQTLERLSEILKKYPSYQIDLEGHAVRTFWASSKKWEQEERDILLPLSLKRATVIKNVLISLGVKESRMESQGFGGYFPIVPHSDTDNRWKNRRVEFILVK